MAINPQIKIKVQTTWVKPVALFVCRHIKSKMVWRLLSRFTIARVYANGVLVSKIKLSEL